MLRWVLRGVGQLIKELVGQLLPDLENDLLELQGEDLWQKEGHTDGRPPIF